MPLMEWKERYQDVGDENGFQFRFFCENCRSPYDTEYVRGNFGVMGAIFGGLISVIGYILVGWLMDMMRGDHDGHLGDGWGLLSDTGEAVTTGVIGAASFGTGISGSLRRRKAKKSLRAAQIDASKHFTSCTRCENLVCEKCYNTDLALCSKCALCPSCGKPIPVGRFCQECGTAFSFGGYTCPSCFAEIERGLRFCPKCGVPLEAGDKPPRISGKRAR